MLRSIMPAISAILARHPKQKAAAPELRRLAFKHKLPRHRVFSAYYYLQEQKDNEK